MESSDISSEDASREGFKRKGRGEMINIKGQLRYVKDLSKSERDEATKTNDRYRTTHVGYKTVEASLRYKARITM